MAERDRRIKRARAAAGDKLATDEGNRLFQEECCQRGTDAGMDHRDPLIGLLQHVNRVATNFAANLVEVVGVREDAGDYVVEEAEDAALWHRFQRLVHPARLDECLWSFV